MRRRQIVSLVVALSFALALGACGSSDKEEPAASVQTLPPGTPEFAPRPDNTMDLAAEAGLVIDSSEHLDDHEHAMLQITVDGEPAVVPANIGVGETTISELHTHDTSGTLHLEAGEEITDDTFNLGQFFDTWDVTLTAEPRSAKGKGPAGRIRKEGLVPAVVYGLGEESVSVTVSERDLRHILAGEAGSNTLITLKVGSASQMTLARQIQRHPIKGTVMHVDFVRVRADQTIQAEIPVHLTGESEGAGRGGVLEQMIHTLTIEALPGDIPSSIEHDVTALEIGDAARVADLAIPSGVTVLQEADEIVVQVSAPRVAEEAAPAEGEEGAVEGAAPAAAAEGDSAGE